MNNKKALLSIVTIISSDMAMLKKTCLSIDKQITMPYEHIVVASNITSLNQIIEINKLKQERRSFIINVDNSLYNAMNIGLIKAKGNCVIFLNGGDEFFSENSICYIYNIWKPDTCLIFRTIQCFENDQYTRPSLKHMSKLKKNSAHQGFIAPIELIKFYYDESKLINADTIWMNEYKSHFEIVISEKVLSIFSLGGLSSLPTIKSIIMRVKSNQLKKTIADIIKFILHKTIGRQFFFRLISKVNSYEYQKGNY